MTKKLPQIYTANHATFQINIRKITVQICGSPSNFRLLMEDFRPNFKRKPICFRGKLLSLFGIYPQINTIHIYVYIYIYIIYKQSATLSKIHHKRTTFTLGIIGFQVTFIVTFKSKHIHIQVQTHAHSSPNTNKFRPAIGQNSFSPSD